MERIQKSYYSREPAQPPKGPPKAKKNGPPKNPKKEKKKGPGRAQKQ